MANESAPYRPAIRWFGTTVVLLRDAEAAAAPHCSIRGNPGDAIAARAVHEQGCGAGKLGICDRAPGERQKIAIHDGHGRRFDGV